MKVYYITILILNSLILYNFNFISKKVKLFDLPDSDRKIHLKPVANIGGLIIFLNFFFFFLFSNLYDEFSAKFVNQIFIFCLIFLFIGIFDDKKNLNANFKLIIFIILAIFLLIFNNNFVVNNLKFLFQEKEFVLNSFSIIFTVICFLAFINAVNMFDGINLQCGLYFLFLSIIFILKGFNIHLYLTIIVGLIFFIYLNRKNLCFLGNSGTYFVSFLFSCSFIYSYNETNSFFVDEIFIVMLIPGLEMIRLTISRIMNRKHPFKADKNHLHHYLLNKFNLNLTIIISFIMFSLPYLFYLIIQDYSLLIILISTLIYFYLVKKLKKKLN